MERQFVLEHLEKLCIGRRYTCEHCGRTASYGAIVGIGCRFSHYDQCAQYPLDCPNDCGEKNIKRRDMKTHRAACLLEPLDCPFRYVGCMEVMQRAHIDIHCQESTQKHVLLLAKSHEELARKNEKLSHQIAALTAGQPKSTVCVDAPRVVPALRRSLTRGHNVNPLEMVPVNKRFAKGRRF